MTINPKVICSAPGKVLICGGYLVLDQAYNGIVCALDSRFHVELEEVPTTFETIDLEIVSPQFTDGLWIYKFDLKNGHLSTTGNNTFLQTVLNHALKYISAKQTLRPSNIKITVNADNDFYSQLEYLKDRNLPATLNSLKDIPKFNAANCSISKVHKTGLGSSAALVAALVSALLLHFGIASVSGNKIKEQSLQIIEQLAQYCHCLAQGKIGSGFDISCAVYGSQLYTRFNPSYINIDRDLTKDEIIQAIEKRWDTSVSNLKLPPGIVLQLGDVNCGSNTPKMVSKVLEWRSSYPEYSKTLWDEIAGNNSKIIVEFSKLVKLEHEHANEYHNIVQRLSSTKPREWDVSTDALGITTSLITIRDTFLTLRKLMKKMGEMANVQIEPDQQTELLDKSLEIEGVFAGGVPGAGGYDAIFCLTLGQTSRTKLLDYWLSRGNVTPLLASQSENGLEFKFK